MIKTQRDLARLSSSAFTWLVNNNSRLLNRLLPKTREIHTFDEILRKASRFTTKRQWWREDRRSYDSAKYNGWIIDIEKELNFKPPFSKKVDMPREEYRGDIVSFFKKFDTIKELLTHKDGKAYYMRARSTGLLKELSKDFKSMVGKSNCKSIINLDTNIVYTSLTLAANEICISPGCITDQIKGKQKTAGGYRWAYCDENGKILK